MTDLAVDCRRTDAGWQCSVTVGHDPAATSHAVTVTDETVARLAPGEADPDRLVEAAFRFLLEREPRESILRSFALTEIERYFPGWEDAVRRR
jgi:hypothetical protein